MEKLMVINIKTNDVCYIAICSSKFFIYIFLFRSNYSKIIVHCILTLSLLFYLKNEASVDIAVGVILDKQILFPQRNEKQA
ncbi:hypothetical protein T07_13387 [Trichinella nelsoni]|uniref:Uncharacterized protein n=1 Tax=Trichinella nelsoni TaxID=6336 RepID=A0A0V0SDE4_9BILA|nr:hypothetical protein T07_13387 [Trichinella nelsoni]